MNTTLSAKFAALALALMVNGVLMGSVAYLFSTQANQTTVSMALVSAQSRAVHDSV